MLSSMKLSDYLQTTSNASLADAIGVPHPLVSQWKTGVRQVPIERCVAIERVTGGLVRRWDLRPDDWRRIWPELIGAPGAPSAPSTTEVA